jgi:hypothetical protein
MRFFLGVGKYTPKAALYGETGWMPPIASQWTCIGRLFVRLSGISNNRINKRIANWGLSKASQKCKNWFYKSTKYFDEHELQVNFDTPISTTFVKSLQDKSMVTFISDWRKDVNSAVGPSGRGRNKLRTYCTFKTRFETERYCKLILPLRHRAALAKFRCGVAPLRLETGRYEGLSIEERLCPFCDQVETEIHVLLECSTYNDLRKDLFRKASNISQQFNLFCDNEKIEFLFNNIEMVRVIAKTCSNILERRMILLCK